MVVRNSAAPQRLLKNLSDNPAHCGATAALFAALVALCQSTAWAQSAGAALPSTGSQGFRIQTSVSLSETYSDNVSLAGSGNAKGEWITRIAPSVSVSQTGPRLRFYGVYSPELLYRAVQASQEVRHVLNATGNAELYKNLFFVDVRANSVQQNVSLAGPQTDSNINTTGNRTTVTTYGISPYLRHDFGYDARGELRFTHDEVHYGSNSGSTSSSKAESISAQLSSGPVFQLFTWGLAYSKAHTEYAQSGQKIDSENVSFTGGRLIVPSVRLNATVGYEDPGYPTSSGSTQKGTFWNVGPTWTPTPNTKVSATIGRRYYGPSKSFHFDHRSRMTTWTVDYSESVTTTRGSLTLPVAADAAALDALLLSSIPDPVARQNRVRELLASGLTFAQPVSFLTDSLFLEKRWQATVGLQGVRNTVLGSVFSSNRNAFSTVAGTAGDFNKSQNVTQTGATVAWNSRLSQRLTANASLGLTRNEFVTTNSSTRLSTLRFGLTEQFSPKLNGALALSRIKSDTTIAGSTSYVENSISATLGLRF